MARAAAKDQEMTYPSYKHSVLATYDMVHANFAYAFQSGTDSRTVDLNKVV